jgi:P27 family predicted phage terminase small subunit
MASVKSKPTNLKLLEGNPGKRPLPKDEFKPEPTMPKPPPMDKATKRIYWYYAEQLEQVGLMSTMDKDMLANVARLIARVNEIDKILRKPEVQMLISYTESAPNGTERPVIKLNPLIREQRDTMAQIRMHAPEFGMTPRGRVGLSVGSSSKKKPKLEGLID